MVISWSGMIEYIRLGKWTEGEIDRLLNLASNIKNVRKRIEFISKQFLDIRYAESTLIGDVNNPEVFVINLEGVDCLTFIEYVEAMRLSSSFSEFKENLKIVRYKSGIVSFNSRKHFFTDWKEYNTETICDITDKISVKKVIRVEKLLNLKKDKSYFISGITPLSREISYIPSEDISKKPMDKLRTGDYIGIYSHLEGLDVSHVGIIIKSRGKIMFRHASSASKKRRVIDEDFLEYINDKPGIVVFRTKTYTS